MIRVMLRGNMPGAIRRALERAGLVVSDPGDVIVVWFDGTERRDDSVNASDLSDVSPRGEPVIALVPRTDLVEQALRNGATEVLSSLPSPSELAARFAALAAFADRARSSSRGQARKMQRATDELERVRSLLDRLIEASQSPVVVADATGRVLRVNPAAASLLGYRAEDATQHLHVRDMYADPDDARRVLAELRATNTTVEFPRMLLRTRAGERVSVRMRAGELHDSDGEPIGTFGVITDLRELDELRGRLDEATERLMIVEHRLAAVRGATRISHELNQPLTAAMGTLEMLELRRDLPPDVTPRLKRAYAQLERMAQLARELGELTQPRADGEGRPET